MSKAHRIAPPMAKCMWREEQMTKAVALYLRVSTGEQTVENQRRGLMSVADRRGLRVVAEFCNEGVSGAKGRRRHKHARVRRFSKCWVCSRSSNARLSRNGSGCCCPLRDLAEAPGADPVVENGQPGGGRAIASFGMLPLQRSRRAVLALELMAARPDCSAAS